MNRRKILVLSIGFTLILITCIIVVIFLIHDIKTEAFDPLDKKLIAPVYVFFVFPIILEELSLLRSVYKLINFRPKTSATSYTMQITYELHDVYDWDRTITSMGNLPVSPRDMWELHHGGMAKNYEVYGKNTFTLSWTKGQTFGEGAVLSNET